MKLPTYSKPLYQLATQALGNPSSFRELGKYLNITPFDPQSKINKLNEIKSVQELRKSVGILESTAIETLGNVQKVANDPAVLDWLMN